MSAAPVTKKSAIKLRGCALIVDDEPANRFLLSLMLQGEGFRTLEAQSGEDALPLFERERPDLVFMDVMLPGMDGYETTRAIKQMAGLDFVPVIFLTSLSEEESLMRCIQAGGDEFLSKPFSTTILKARILAMERVRDLQRALATKQRDLSYLLEQEHQQQTLAEQVWSQAVKGDNVTLDQIGLVERPAAIFNGDLVLSQILPNGGLRVLVGDFTGHGLAATIGALPVASTFHAMTRKGLGDRELLNEINGKLHQILPADRFMAVCLISISHNGKEVRWWNGGMPSAWLRTARDLIELAPHALPLGVLPQLQESGNLHRTPVEIGDRLLLMTDGLLEAENTAGQMFFHTEFSEILSNWQYGTPILPILINALDRHCANTEQTDDIAILEIPMNPQLFTAPQPSAVTPAVQRGWRWSLDLRDNNLARQPSLAAILKSIGFLDDFDTHLGTLETIFTELYANALEHGILKLDSSIKSTPEGFDAYYRDRERRLAEGCTGRVTLHLTYKPLEKGGCLLIRISDSGNGFNPEEWLKARQPTYYWGRGITLVRNLCESLNYRRNGSQVEAIYRW